MSFIRSANVAKNKKQAYFCVHMHRDETGFNFC